MTVLSKRNSEVIEVPNDIGSLRPPLRDFDYTERILLGITICDHLGEDVGCGLVAAGFLVGLLQLLLHR